MDQQDQKRYTKLLFAIGVVATNHGLCKKADDIIQPLVKLNPTKEEPIIGLGYNLITWAKPAKAVELFRDKARSIKTPSPMYDAMTGFALFLNKQFGEAERLFNAVKSRGQADPVAVRLAESLLVEMGSSSPA